MKRKLSKKGTLCVIGNVASGKSTAVSILAKALEGKPIYADDLFQTTDPFRERFLKNIKRWAFANELWMVLRRIEVLEEYKKEANKKWLVIDSGLLMSWAYTYSHLTAGNLDMDEWQLFDEIFRKVSSGLFENLAVVVLESSTPTLMKRIKNRGRDYELEFYSEEYIDSLARGIDELKKLLEEKGVLYIEIKEKEVGNFAVAEAGKKELVKFVLSRLNTL